MKQIQVREKFKLLQDDDGHWYAIPHQSTDDFYRWVAGDETVVFYKYRLEQSLSSYCFRGEFGIC